MPRETIEERRARLEPGAHWIRAQRERRGWTGRELARRMDIAQDRVSAYERAQDEPPTEFARSLAKVFGMTEIEVWRGLRKPLPAEVRTDAEVVEWAWRTVPEAMEEITGRKAPRPLRQDGGKRTRVTRQGDNPSQASSGEETAI